MRPQPLFSPALALLALFLACACAPKAPPPPVAAPQEKTLPDRGDAIWRAFQDKASGAAFLSGPFRIACTLRYTNDKGETTRASSLLWGNGDAADPHPLRLDILTGMGTVAAKIRESGSDFLAYVPDEKRAWRTQRKERALAAFGVPVPLSLGSLTQMLTGLPGALFLPAAALGTPPYVPTERGARFAVTDSALPGELELSPEGVPLAWREAEGRGWSIVFEPDTDNPLRPKKLRIAHPAGYSALITVKEAARVSPPYTKEQMGLELPPDAAMQTDTSYPAPHP